MLRWWVRGLLDLRGFVVAPTPRVETMRSIRTLRPPLYESSLLRIFLDVLERALRKPAAIRSWGVRTACWFMP